MISHESDPSKAAKEKGAQTSSSQVTISNELGSKESDDGIKEFGEKIGVV